ncbi:hypothetical protein SAMN05216550_1413 [Paraburkholderia tropica]|uniref:Uncharacterized protein n=1 Tax=Paraburkholderia tropica TaxID=92647 RepID=A0AAQ1GPS9_9BURK|nr:hypothetical protein SAMN05216550_1413 [Paraburkholderia tropica]
MRLRWRNRPTCETRTPGSDRTLPGQKRSLDIAFMIVNNRQSSTSLTNSML